VNKKSIKSDLTRIDGMKDIEIDYSDIPPLDNSFYTKATLGGTQWSRAGESASCARHIEAWPPAKQQLTIRLDVDVLS
jgi:hypothetical protein